MHKYQRFSVNSAAAVGSLVVRVFLGLLVRIRIHAELFRTYRFGELCFLRSHKKTLKSDVDERGHRLRFLHTLRRVRMEWVMGNRVDVVRRW